MAEARHVPGDSRKPSPSLIRRMERRVRKRRLSDHERSILVSARPVALLIDEMSDWSYEQLVREKERIEEERRLGGIHPLDWYRLQAIRALIQHKEMAAAGYTGDVVDEDEEPDLLVDAPEQRRRRRSNAS